jgi:hypothetical protein
MSLFNHCPDYKTKRNTNDSNLNNDLIYFITFFALLIVSFIGTTWMHETVHVLNNEKVGIKSHLEFAMYKDFMPSIVTVGESGPVREFSNLELAHSFNEAINYNLVMPLFGVMSILIVGFYYLGNKIEGLGL